MYSEEGQRQVKAQVAYYMENARIIADGLRQAGYEVYGGKNAPYIWLRTPAEMTSWEFFDYLLEKANVVGTPGSGFGPHGEHYFRLTAFGSRESTEEALGRIGRLCQKQISSCKTSKSWDIKYNMVSIINNPVLHV